MFTHPLIGNKTGLKSLDRTPLKGHLADEKLPCQPRTLRANSQTASCIPRHTPAIQGILLGFTMTGLNIIRRFLSICHINGGFQMVIYFWKLECVFMSSRGGGWVILTYSTSTSSTATNDRECVLGRSLPRNGFFCFLAQEMAWIFPSVPRTPNPPGTRMPLNIEG